MIIKEIDDLSLFEQRLRGGKMLSLAVRRVTHE